MVPFDERHSPIAKIEEPDYGKWMMRTQIEPSIGKRQTLHIFKPDEFCPQTCRIKRPTLEEEDSSIIMILYFKVIELPPDTKKLEEMCIPRELVEWRGNWSKVKDNSGKSGVFRRINVFPRSNGLVSALDDDSETTSPRMDTGWQSFASFLHINGIVKTNHDQWHALGNT